MLERNQDFNSSVGVFSWEACRDLFQFRAIFLTYLQCVQVVWVRNRHPCYQKSPQNRHSKISENRHIFGTNRHFCVKQCWKMILFLFSLYFMWQSFWKMWHFRRKSGILSWQNQIDGVYTRKNTKIMGFYVLKKSPLEKNWSPLDPKNRHGGDKSPLLDTLFI